MSLNVQRKFSEIRQRFEEDPSQETFNALICGESGTGKTYILHTARKPVLIDSFDPGGAKCLRPWIQRGEILVDSRWEKEDPEKPSVYDKWQRAINQRFREGLFNHLGTYVIDSATMWAEAIMNDILRKAGRAGQPPQWGSDYQPQKVLLRNNINKLMSLPCDFILTGHLGSNTDEVTGRVTYRFLAPGKGSVTIPLLFDEIYVTQSQEKPKGVKYSLLTAGAGRYLARSRLSQDGKIPSKMEPNIKKILKRAGYPTEDKPLFTETA